MSAQSDTFNVMIKTITDSISEAMNEVGISQEAKDKVFKLAGEKAKKRIDTLTSELENK